MPRIAGDRGEGVQAVVLALQILEYLSEQRRDIGVTTLAQALGTTKSRIYRHLRTLVQQGYIVQSLDSDRYQVGSRLVRLGRTVNENLDLARAAHSTLVDLRDLLGHFTVVSEIEADGIRVLATVPGKSSIQIGVKQGSLLAFHSSAQGKVALAFGPDRLRAKVFRSRLDLLTPATIVSPAALRKEIDQVRGRGYAVAPNETAIGLNALAAPIFDALGTAVGTVAIVDSIQFIQADPSEEQIRETVAAAQRISESLGFAGH